MPGVKRRGGPVVRVRKLDHLEMLNFRVGIGALYEAGEEAAAAIYALNREALLSGGNWPVLLCEPFWRFEPGIPDELGPREDDEVCYGDDFGRLVERHARREHARLAWLLGHRELFEGLPDGERLYARLRARQLAEQAA